MKAALALIVVPALASGAVALPVAAQGFPVKPLRIVVAFPPGGGIDALARLTGAGLSERLGQPVAVENRAGASGLLATEAVLAAPPDGHTLLCNTHGEYAILQHVYAKLPFNAQRELAPLVKAVTVPMVVAVRADSPAQSMKDLLAQARANPGKLSYGTSVPGSTMHVLLEQLAQSSGIEYVHVAYKGGQPVVNDLLGGVLHFAGLGLPNVEALVRGGKLRALALLSNERSELVPGVPSMPEAAGAKLGDLTTWYGFSARAGLPRESAERIKGEMRAVLLRPENKTRLAAFAMEVVALPSEQFAGSLPAEAAAYGEALRKAGIQPQ